MPVIGATTAVLLNRAPELRHREDDDVIEAILEVTGKGGDRGAQIAQPRRKLTFDAALIDAGSVNLDGMVVKVRGKGNKFLANIQDVNADGYDDLKVKIEDADGVYAIGETTATLTGKLLDGTQFQGTEFICVK